MNWRNYLFLLALLSLPGVSCKDHPSDRSRSTVVGRHVATQKPAAKAGERAKPRHTARPPRPRPVSQARSLVREAARAELDQGGLLVDLGSGDQHKALHGSFRVSLGRAGRHKGASFQTFVQTTPVFWHDWDGGITAVVVRARRVGEVSTFGMSLDGKHLGTRPLTEVWSVLTFALPEPSRPGRRKLVLEVELPAGRHNGVALDWIWFRRGEGSAPSTDRVGVRSFGDPRRSLLGGRDRTFRFYMHLPRRATLSFAVGAKAPTRFQVTVNTDGAAAKEVFSEEHGGRWKEAKVDLSPWTGRTVRLDLSTTSGGDTAAWAEPVVTPRARHKPVQPPSRDRTAQNLVHLVVDTARRDAYRPFAAKTRVTTPATVALARRGTTFTRAYTNANFTLPSVSSFLSGRHFVTFFGDINDRPKVPESLPLLPQYLQKQGFTTVALVANPYVSKPFGLHRGWGTLRHFDSGKPSGSASGVYAAATAWIDAWMADPSNRSRRFYLYVHTMDPHMPYFFHKETTPRYHPKRYRGKVGRDFAAEITDEKPVESFGFTAADKRYIRALYHGEVSFNDMHLKGFLDALARHKLFKNTMVVHSNDHGEELFDHGGLGHGTTLYDEQIRAPLIIVHPHLYPAGAQRGHLVSLVDLVPTILEGLGVPPLAGTHGRSLYRAAHQQADATTDYVFAASENRAVVLGHHKLILGRNKPLLFDLASDPNERKNRADAEPIALRACEIALSEANAVPARRQRLHRVTAHRLKTEKAVLDHATFKQLKGLGYIK